MALIAILWGGHAYMTRTITVPPAALEISRETTYLTQPLTLDGRVDYLAALNREPLPAPAENAAVLIAKVLGRQAFAPHWNDVQTSLGAPRDLAATPLFTPRPEPLESFLRYPRDFGDEAQNAALRSWLDSNARAFEVVHEASRRPRLRWPTIRDPETHQLQRALPDAAWSDVLRAWVQRALLTLKESQPEAGWRHMQTLLRLTVLMAETPDLWSRIRAYSLRDRAFQWIEHALAGAHLDAALAATIQSDLQTLRPLPTLDLDVLGVERLRLLGTHTATVRQAILDEGGDPDWHPANVALDAALREVNLAYDVQASALRATPEESLEPSRHATLQRAATARDWERRLDALEAEGANLNSRRAGRLAGYGMAEISLRLAPFLLERTLADEAERKQLLVALALRRYEQAHGTFPGRLAHLDPQLRNDLDVDLSSFAYERDEDGCVLGGDEREITIKKGLTTKPR